MEIKLTDILNLMSNCNSRSELKIKCDLLYGEDFDFILYQFLQKMNYTLESETLAAMTIRDLMSYLKLICENFEFKNRQYTHMSVEHSSVYFSRFSEEYYLPNCCRYENISINIK